MSRSRPFRYYVYVMASRSGVVYVGVTNNLERRVSEHKTGVVEGFMKRYRLSSLVYFETFGSVESAIAREKEIKKWRREKKVRLIEESNPDWRDLSLDW